MKTSVNDMIATLGMSQAFAKVLEDAKKEFAALAENHDIRTIMWVTADPATYDATMEPEDYHEAPDYSMLQIGNSTWEITGVNESQKFFPEVITQFVSWAITVASQLNSKASYNNVIRKQKGAPNSKFVHRIDSIKHSIYMPEYAYTGKKLDAQTTASAATTYFS